MENFELKDGKTNACMTKAGGWRFLTDEKVASDSSELHLSFIESVNMPLKYLILQALYLSSYEFCMCMVLFFFLAI